jgi:hypothetical protein
MDLPVTPDFPIEENIRHNTLVSEFDNGVEQRRSKWATPLREFPLTFRNRPKAEYDSFVAFLELKLGQLTSFTFDNLNDGETYTVRFKDDNIRFSQVNYQMYSWECTLIEVKQ